MFTKRDGSLLSSPGFSWFVLARLLVWAGAGTSVVVLPVLVHDRTGSASLTALVGAVEVLPYLILGLPAGSLADRHGRRAIMVGGCAAASMALASVPLAMLAGGPATSHVLGAALVVGLALVLVDAAAFASIPTLVGRERIAEANGLLTTLGTIVGLVAPGVGGLLLTVLRPASVLWVEVACLALAAVLAIALRQVDRDRSADPPPESFARSIAVGVRFVASHALIGPLTFLGIGVSLASGAVVGLQVPYAIEVHHVRESSGLLGLVFVASALGSVLAGVTAPRVRRRWSPGAVATVGYAAGFALVCGLAYAPSLPVALGALTCWSWCSVTVVINGIVTRQELAPETLQGRVHATARMIAWGGQPLGALLASALVGSFGIRQTLVVAALGLVVATAVALALRLPGRRPAPAEPEEVTV
ncbi:MFS transporter [Mariniluteicoccus flavus]